MPKESDYWIGKNRRSMQIYNWFNDVVFSNNLSFFYDEIKVFLINGENNLAVNRFKELVSTIRQGNQFGENGDTLGYIINLNVDRFGVNRVVLDLFNGTVRIRFRIKRKVTKKPSRITETTIKEVTKEVKTKAKVRKGINIKGKREKAVIRIRKNGTIWLQSKKTGKILKQSKAFKKEVKARGKKKK